MSVYKAFIINNFKTALFIYYKRDAIHKIIMFRTCVLTIGIPMGTLCAPLLADLLFYLYEADFIQGHLQKKEKKLVRSLNFTFSYTDDVFH